MGVMHSFHRKTHSYPSPSGSVCTLSLSLCALLLFHRDYCREQILARRPALRHLLKVLLLEDDKERNLVFEGV